MWHRRIKSLHGWLGLFAWPWVVMIALSGIYQNRQSAIDPWLPGDAMTAERLNALPAHPVTAAEAATRLGPMEPVTVFGHAGWQAVDGSGGIDGTTGASWQSGTFLTTWRDASGARIGWRVEWQKLFLRLHRAGWAGDRFGTWPADLAGAALVGFGLSGLWLFLGGKLRRWRR